MLNKLRPGSTIARSARVASATTLIMLPPRVWPSGRAAPSRRDPQSARRQQEVLDRLCVWLNTDSHSVPCRAMRLGSAVEVIDSLARRREVGAHHRLHGGRKLHRDHRTTERVVIRTSITIAATPGAEPIATGEVLEGSTLGGSPFCGGGTILDSHASADPL